ALRLVFQIDSILPTKHLARVHKVTPKTVRRWKRRPLESIKHKPRSVKNLTIIQRIRITRILKNNGGLNDAAKSINKSKSYIYNHIRKGKQFKTISKYFLIKQYRY